MQGDEDEEITFQREIVTCASAELGYDTPQQHRSRRETGKDFSPEDNALTH